MMKRTGSAILAAAFLAGSLSLALAQRAGGGGGASGAGGAAGAASGGSGGAGQGTGDAAGRQDIRKGAK